MRQILTFDLDELTAALDVREGNKEVSYAMRLEPDRSMCMVVRTVFDDMEGGDPVGQEVYERPLDDLKNDGGLPHHLIWAARGLWGIPLEFGRARTAPQELPVSDVGDTAKVAPSPRRASKK